MWLQSVTISNFRNITKQHIDLDRKINLFVGDNAQGKTNIIESMYVLATTKSFKAGKDVEMIRWNAGETLIEGKSGSNDIKVLLNKDGKKAYINKRLKKKAELIGIFPAVLFSPESLAIVFGPPEKRRRYLDQLLSVTDKNYLYSLSRYLKVVKNRNRLLFILKQGGSGDLGIWDKQLASLGSIVWEHRLSFVEEANKRLKTIGAKLIGADIRIEYSPIPIKSKDKKEIRRGLESEIARYRDEDLSKTTTSIGPHRDDFKILFDIYRNESVLEKEIGTFGSRGEQRIATLALKLVEVEYLEKIIGERPTLLLDDVLSEFDKKNREHVINLLSRQQSMLTTTSVRFFSRNFLSRVKTFEVRDGRVYLAERTG